jgi:hypothetical protein
MKTRRAIFSSIGAIIGAVAIPTLALPIRKSKLELQQELLDDAAVVYRIGRAPDRRIFHIDVGSLPPAHARARIAQIKNDIIVS